MSQRQEIVAGVLAGLFGCLLLGFPHVFDAPVYGLMRVFSPENWGAVFVCLALVRILYIFTEGSTSRAITMRLYASIGSALLVWLPFAVSFWWFAYLKLSGGAGEVLPGVILAVGMLAMELLTAERLMGARKEIEV